MGAGFRSANRSVAGSASAVLWCLGRGSQVRQRWHRPAETHWGYEAVVDGEGCGGCGGWFFVDFRFRHLPAGWSDGRAARGPCSRMARQCGCSGSTHTRLGVLAGMPPIAPPSRRGTASWPPCSRCLRAASDRRRSPLSRHTAIPEGPASPDPSEAVTICRRHHRLEGMTVAVIGVRNAGRRGLRVKVRLPDGSSCWLPLSWTSLGGPAADAPQLAGELPDWLAWRNVVRTLAERCGTGDGERADTAAAGVGGTLAALAERAASGAGTAAAGTGADDDSDRGGGR